MRTLISLACFSIAVALLADEPPRFRTDKDGPATIPKTKPKKGKPSGELEWYSLVNGKFPPEGSAHAISGELIFVDHLERRFHFRVDRNDSQDRGLWDLPVDAEMLPYGSIWYHGAPADLRDIPLGTHLHGLFYQRAEDDRTPMPPTAHNRRTAETDFRRCFRLEDDISYRARQKQTWRIGSVDLAARKLFATLEAEGGLAGAKPQAFDLTSAMRVYEGNGFGTLQSLKPGQSVLFNLTWATLYGPGRITEIWLDEPSRALAAAQQLEVHRNHVRERGLPGWVTAVDDEAQIVTILFFGNVDPKLFEEIMLTNPEPIGWPLSKPEDNPAAAKGTIAVARESLMTYDPVNDRKGGNILDVKKVPLEPGSSGVQVRVKCDMLLEGYRPRRVVRFYPATWKVLALPREEQYQGRE